MLDEHLEDLAQRRPRGRGLARVGGVLLQPPKLDERRLPVGAVRVDLFAQPILVDVPEPDPPSPRHSTLLFRHVPPLTAAAASPP